MSYEEQVEYARAIAKELVEKIGEPLVLKDIPGDVPAARNPETGREVVYWKGFDLWSDSTGVGPTAMRHADMPLKDVVRWLMAKSRNEKF